jgi:hypothetical protein
MGEVISADGPLNLGRPSVFEERWFWVRMGWSEGGIIFHRALVEYIFSIAASMARQAGCLMACGEMRENLFDGLLCRNIGKNHHHRGALAAEDVNSQNAFHQICPGPLSSGVSLV